MRAKDFIPASKPRNPVVRQQQTSGAGAHRDRKKEQKQGYEKHKGKSVSEGGDVFYNAGETANKKPVGKGTTVKNKITGIVGKAYSWSVVKGVPYLYVKGDDDRYQSPAKDWLVVDEQGVSEGSYTTEKQIMTRIRQIMYDRKLSGTDSNAGELHRLKQQLKDLRSQQSVSEGYGTKEFEVDGYTYMTDLDREEDNQKIWHMIKTPDGETVNVDFTPYAYMTKDDVEFYVKLGMPKRQGVGPLDSEQLQKMAQIKGVAMLDPKMARAGL